MAALRFVIVSLLASAAAAPPARDNPTKYSSNNNTLEEKKTIAEEGCSHLPPHTICHISCLYKSIGVLGNDGRYLESGAADVMAIFGDDNKINPVAMKNVAKTCNAVNDHIVEGCSRAGQISECLQTELDKIFHRDSRAAKSAAASKTCVDAHDSCHKSCVLTSFGVLDNGRINTYAVIDLLAVNYPTLTLNKLEQMARSCNGVNKRYVGCEGASELATCFEEKYVNFLKETGKQT